MRLAYTAVGGTVLGGLLIAGAATRARAEGEAPVAPLPAAGAALERIAFGSCAVQLKPQTIWNAVLGTDPDLFVLLGDNVYADIDGAGGPRRAYADWVARPEVGLFRSRVPILATWDDHDYGKNDGGADFPGRADSEAAFLDLFAPAPDDPRRARPGVYDARVFGPPGRRVQVVLLDTRYHRSPLTLRDGEPGRATGRPGGYASQETGTLLGEEQWAWLTHVLSEPAELRLVASSIQVLSEDHRFERWMEMPHERARLLELIASTGAGGVLFLSGDRHSAELSWLPAAGRDDPLTGEVTRNPAGYPLFDVTSSSLNTSRPFQNEINRHRIGTVYWKPNFGLVAIDWEARTVTLEIRSEHGELELAHQLSLDELTPPVATTPTTTPTSPSGNDPTP